MLTEWQASRQAGRHPLPSSTAFLWSHLLWKLRFSLQEIVTKDEDKKTITCPEQLISVSCICVSAKILPYTETLRRGPGKPVQGLEALSSVVHMKVGRTQFFLVKMQRDALLYHEPTAGWQCSTFLPFNARSVYLSRWPLRPSLRSAVSESDTIFPSRNTFQKIISDQQNQQELEYSAAIEQASRREPPLRQRKQACNHQPRLNHNMWPLSQHGWDWLLFTEECLCSTTEQWGKHLSDGKTELINWFALVKAAGIIRTEGALSSAGHRGMTFLCSRRHTVSPPHPRTTAPEYKHHVIPAKKKKWKKKQKNVPESETAQHDIISEMCASTVIFGRELNCKRQTWISLCLSLSSRQEQSQNFGWSSSWPRCSVQISATRWRWRPLHRTAQTGWIL